MALTKYYMSVGYQKYFRCYKFNKSGEMTDIGTKNVNKYQVIIK